MLYLLFKNFKGPFPYRDIFGLLSIIALLLSVGIFLTLNAFDKLTTKTLNISLINSLSLWLFGSCILITFLINILDNAISLNDIRADIETTQQNLANEFDKIGD